MLIRIAGYIAIIVFGAILGNLHPTINIPPLLGMLGVALLLVVWQKFDPALVIAVLAISLAVVAFFPDIFDINQLPRIP